MTDFKIILVKLLNFTIKYFFSITFKFFLLKKENTFVHLRYFFGGGRPSQTTQL